MIFTEKWGTERDIILNLFVLSKDFVRPFMTLSKDFVRLLMMSEGQQLIKENRLREMTNKYHI